MPAHPILINRPIMAAHSGRSSAARSEVILDILPNPDTGHFITDDGEVVIDVSGRRVR